MKKLFCILLALIMVFALAACGAQNNNNAAPDSGNNNNAVPEKESKYGGTFVAAVGTSPGCLFYPYQYASVSTYVYPAVETLRLRNPETGKYEPNLCESWETDLENHTLTMKIRQGVKFHDGSDLNAEVVKWNFEKIKEYGNESVIQSPTNIEVLDEYTIKVTFPNFDLNQESFTYSVLIYSKKAFEDHGLEWCINNCVGTGPFKLKENVPDSYLLFERFDNYWKKDAEGNQLPYLDYYKIQVIPDASAQMTAFSSNEIHRFPCSDMQIAESMYAMGYPNKAQIGEANSAIVYGVYANNTIEGDPWSDVRVRQALLLHGIDWNAVAYVAGGKTAFEIMTPLIETGDGYDASLMSASKYDVAKAKEMLKEAGYENGFKTKILKLDYGTKAATEIQSQLKTNFGIEAEIVNLVNGDDRRFDGVNEGIYLNYGYTTADFARHLRNMFCPTGTYKNVHKYSDEYVAMRQQMLDAKTIEEKCDLIKKLSYKLMVEECLFRQMYAVPNNIFIQDYVHDSGLERSVDGITPETTWLDAAYRK